MNNESINQSLINHCLTNGNRRADPSLVCSAGRCALDMKQPVAASAATHACHTAAPQHWKQAGRTTHCPPAHASKSQRRPQHWKQAGKTLKCCTSLTNCIAEKEMPKPVPLIRKKAMMKMLSA